MISAPWGLRLSPATAMRRRANGRPRKRSSRQAARPTGDAPWWLSAGPTNHSRRDISSGPIGGDHPSLRHLPRIVARHRNPVQGGDLFFRSTRANARCLDGYTPTMPDAPPAESERPVASTNPRPFGPALIVVLVGGKLFSAILDWPDPRDALIVLGFFGLLACAVYFTLTPRFRKNDRGDRRKNQ